MEMSWSKSSPSLMSNFLFNSKYNREFKATASLQHFLTQQSLIFHPAHHPGLMSSDCGKPNTPFPPALLRFFCVNLFVLSTRLLHNFCPPSLWKALKHQLEGHWPSGLKFISFAVSLPNYVNYYQQHSIAIISAEGSSTAYEETVPQEVHCMAT